MEENINLIISFVLIAELVWCEMILKDLVDQIEFLKVKIEELNKILHQAPDDSVAKELWSLLDLRQSKLLYLDKAYKEYTVAIGKSEISLSTAVIIRKVMCKKLKILTGLINNEECRLDKIELIKQRDKVFEEFTILDSAIKLKEFKINVE